MKIDSATLAALTADDIEIAGLTAEGVVEALEERGYGPAAEWWQAVAAAIAEHAVYRSVGALPEQETDVRVESLGLGREQLGYVAALLQGFRDDLARPDALRAVWAELLAALDDFVYERRPRPGQDRDAMLAALVGEPVERHGGFAWTATPAEALAEMVD